MSNQTDHTIVRLRVPPELKQKIEEAAENNNRSQSAEMVARLEQSFTSGNDQFVPLSHVHDMITESIGDAFKSLALELKDQKLAEKNVVDRIATVGEFISEKKGDKITPYLKKKAP